MRPHSKLFWRERKNGSTVGDCVNFGSCCNPPAVASDEKQGCLPSKSRAIGLALWAATPSLAIGFGNSCQVNQPPNKINKFCRQHSIRRRAQQQQLQKPIKYPIDGIEALTIAFQYDGKRVKVTRARESGIVAMQHSRLKSILKVTFMMALCL